MAVVNYRGGNPYSADYLSQLSSDLDTLANDMRNARCAVERITAIEKAAKIVRMIRSENAEGAA